METYSDLAALIKSAFDDIEVFHLEKLESDDISNDEKLSHLEEIEYKLQNILEDIDRYKREH